VGGELVKCALDVVSVHVVKRCKGGTVMGDFILFYGKVYQIALSILEVLKLCLSTSVGPVRLI
jgi:hypothetical protein